MTIPPSLRAALVILIASVVFVGAAPSLTVKTSTLNTEVGGLENLKVTATIFNTGDETLKLLNDPRGVLSSFPENSFSITNAAGSRPLFDGAKVKYSPAHATALDDPRVFTVLAPGASINITHDLSAAYNFTRSGAGDYTIKPSNLFTYVDVRGTLKNLYATVEDVAEVKLSGSLAVSRTHDKRDSYPGCTAGNRLALAAAAAIAQEYVNEAYSYLKGISSGTPRYTLWFGVYNPSRKSTVQDHFWRISSHEFSSFTYDCKCAHGDRGFLAYVKPNAFGIIHICSDFWEVPYTGTDSMAGTLIHEFSHFSINGHTYDYYYGREKSTKLATDNPDDAIFNADNYEYFAENTPYFD